MIKLRQENSSSIKKIYPHSLAVSREKCIKIRFEGNVLCGIGIRNSVAEPQQIPIGRVIYFYCKASHFCCPLDVSSYAESITEAPVSYNNTTLIHHC